MKEAKKDANIICTLGTTTDSKSELEKMIAYGMTGSRINTAYADISDYESRINLVREASISMSSGGLFSKHTSSDNQPSHIDIMLDIKGPQIRLNNFESFKVFKGSYFYIDFPDEKEIEKTINNEINKICFNKNFNKDVKIGDNILIENGSIITEVETRDKYGVLLKVIEPGEGTIHKYMSVNVPGVYLNVDRLTSKDMEVIKFGLDKGVEQIALSFVRDQIDVKNCYDFMKNYSIEKSQNTELCLKIEDKFGVQNLNEILDYVKSENIKSSVMVARGDLFVELKNEELPFAQEYIIETCKKYDVPVIVGTGILSSMQHCSKPTRSEICDVYGMLKSGVNNFMLSGETSFGDNPALVVKTLNDITKRYYDDSKLKT